MSLAWRSFSQAKWKSALVYSMIAAMLATAFLALARIHVDDGAYTKEITGYGLGYWLWMLSPWIIVIASGTIRLRPERFEKVNEFKKRSSSA